MANATAAAAPIARTEAERLTDSSLVYNVHVAIDGADAIILAALSRQHALELTGLINECAHVCRAATGVA